MSLAENLTPRQFDGWGDILNWAAENDIEDGLKLLVDCTIIHDQTNLLPTVIERLTSKNCIDILNRWSKTDSYAHHLNRILTCFHADPHLILNSNIFSDHKPAKRQFHSKLNFQYVISSIFERIPSGTSNEVIWFERLRLWLVVMAMRCASSHNLQDAYLRYLFSYMRMAFDLKTDKLALIKKLMIDVNGYQQFTATIKMKADWLSLSLNKSSGDYKFLKTLIKVCDHNFNPEDAKKIVPLYDAPKRFTKEANSKNTQDLNLDLDFDESFDSNEKVLEVSDDADEELGVKFDVDPKQSQQLKSLKGNSVLLSTVEELQFLPWTWIKPNTIETEILLSSNDKLLYSDRRHRLLAAIVWISVNTGRSFRRALDIQISEIGDDWTFNPTKKILQRNQPNRKNSWTPKSEKENEWIYSIIEKQQIILPKTVLEIVNHELSENPHAKKLIQLWNKKEWGMPERLFYEQFGQLLPRITPGMLGNILPQHIFTATENDKFTRLISSHPNTGLPPASAYSAWMQNEHTQVLSQFIPSSEAGDKNKIGAGSRLYPIESLLKNAILDAGVKLEAVRQTGDLIHYHNHLTAYIYTMILAATGCRPINDLVESIRQFDFDKVYFYVDDKSNSRGNKGRLIALPDNIISFVSNEYLHHLRIVAQSIGVDKSPLAYEINEMSQGRHSSKVPFLFFLETKDDLNWVTVSASEVNKLNLFNWPLPANLFRHRLAKLLPAECVHQEVVDGFLGHLESGLESYGIFSSRTFSTDIKALRPVLNKLFNKLDFYLPKHQPYLILNESCCVTNVLHERTFGSESRAKIRKARIVNAIKAAKWEIEKTLGERSFDLLDDNEIEVLSKSMLFHQNGLPRSDGFLRYSFLLKKMNQHSQKTGVAVKLKKQYVFAETNSPFSQVSIQAQRKYDEILESTEKRLLSTHTSRFSATDAAFIGVLMFSLENRVSNKKLLKKVFMGTHFRIVRLKDKFYAEFSSSEKIESLLIVSKRFSISNACAYWMQNAKKLSLSAKFLDKPVSRIFEGIGDIIFNKADRKNNFNKLIDDICEVINQANFIELPGIVAAYLSGKVDSYSWNWSDLIRFNLGDDYRLDNQLFLTDFQTSQINIASDFLPATLHPFNIVNEESDKQNVKNFFHDIRKVLSSENSHGNNITNSRTEKASRINALINHNAATVSQSCLLLALWIKNLIEKKRTATDYYAISTIERYFSALSKKFEVLAYATNLVDMDEEDITELYSNIVELAKKNDKPYVGRRLIGFHKWARGQGVEEPDWSEIDIPDSEDFVSPGFIFENDYQKALMHLTQSNTQFDIHERFSALLLLLTYRFGLRGGEALGLLASDLFFKDEMIVVNVADNQYRKLKRTSSRRQVPLVFDLSKYEKSIIEWGRNQLSALPDSDPKTPLFNIGGEFLSEQIRDKIKRNVISVLRQVTGNGDVVIHHARHAAANKVGHTVIQNPDLFIDKEFELIQKSARATLLGTTNHTRRELWASARYLGQATPLTQIKSYIHFIGDWSAQYNKSLNLKKQYEIADVIDIAQYATKTGELSFQLLENVQVSKVKETVTMFEHLQLFRLLANGKDPELAAITLGISVDTVSFSYELLKAVSLKSDRLESSQTELGIFQKATPVIWKRLFNYVKSLKDDEPLAVDFQKVDFEIEKILPMFGARGHILMRYEFQFRVMKTFFSVFNVPSNLYDVFVPKNANTMIISLAESVNFNPVVIGSNTERGSAYKGYQLDSYVGQMEGETLVQRCAIVFKQESFGYARNSNNWTLLIVLFVIYLKTSVKS